MPATKTIDLLATAEMRLAAIEEFMDAKIAFARMTPDQRRPLIDALADKRRKAVAALRAMEASNGQS